MKTLAIQEFQRLLMEEARFEAELSANPLSRFESELATARAMLYIVPSEFLPKYRAKINTLVDTVERLKARPVRIPVLADVGAGGKLIRLFKGMFMVRIQSVWGDRGSGIRVTLEQEYGELDSSNLDRNGDTPLEAEWTKTKRFTLLGPQRDIQKVIDIRDEQRRRDEEMRRVKTRICDEVFISTEYFRSSQFPMEHIVMCLRDSISKLAQFDKMAEVIALQMLEFAKSRRL